MTRSSSWSFGNSIRPRTASSQAVTPSSGMRKRIAPSSSYALPSATSCCASSRQRSIASSWKVTGPSQSIPSHCERALDLLGRLLDLAAGVRVLDPQQALAVAAAREEEVEEERAHAADVQEPGRARGHADAHAHAASVAAGSRRRTAQTDGIEQDRGARRRSPSRREPERVREPDPAASGPAIARPSGVSTNEPSAS